MTLEEWLRDFHASTFAWDAPHAYFWWAGTIGGLFLVLLLLNLRLPRKRYPVFRDEEGSVWATERALRDLVNLACESVVVASRPRIQFRENDGRLSVFVEAKLYEGQHMTDVRDRLRRQVSKVLGDMQGVQLGEIDFTATAFKPGRGAPRREDHLKATPALGQNQESRA